MRRTATVRAVALVVVGGTLGTSHTKQVNLSADWLTQEQSKAQTFSGKIVSQNGVRFVLRDDENNVWYHLDDQQKAGNLFGKNVLVTGTFDGLTGTIRVQSIVEATPHEKPPANAEEMKQNSEPPKGVAAPPTSTNTVAPSSQRASPAQESVGNVPTPRFDARTSRDSGALHRSQSEVSVSQLAEAPPTSYLTLPEEPVSASSSVAISSHRLVPMPPHFNTQTQPTKNLLVGRLLKRVDPSYPPEAIQQRIEGTVQLHAVIGEDGKVESLEAVSGPPLLVAAAIIAVREWRYAPTLLEGHRIQIQEDIRLVFRLPE